VVLKILLQQQITTRAVPSLPIGKSSMFLRCEHRKHLTGGRVSSAAHKVFYRPYFLQEAISDGNDPDDGDRRTLPQRAADLERAKRWN
jgi:hypothetical protein